MYNILFFFNTLILMEIKDSRTNFQSITFCNYKKSHVIKELVKSLYYQKLEEAFYWTADLLASGLIIDLWNIYVQFVCKYIHINNPKLPIYIYKKFEEFKMIANKISDLELRNNADIRILFFSLTAILCDCKKDSILDNLKFDLKFDIQTNLKAPNIQYIQPYFKAGDPKEYFIALNELMYHLKDTKNKMDILYWIEWIVEFEQLLIKNLFKIKYTTASNRKKKGILHLAVMFIINDIDYQKKLVENVGIFNNIEQNILITFQQLKKNEI